MTPVLVNPPYVGRTLRDASFARAACAKLATMPDALVQSHERIACCDIYRAGDGVHAVWVEERLRDAPRLAAAAHRSESVSPLHARSGEAALRERALASRDLHLAHGADGDPRALRLRARAHCRSSTTRSTRRCSIRVCARIATRSGRCTASRPTRSCSCWSARRTRARASDARSRRSRRCRRRPTCSSWVATSTPRDTSRRRADCGVAGRVTFAGAQTDPKPYYGAADAFVLPTLYDALSNAVLEALACGLPVVTSDRCGAGELVAEHGAGTVCGARDIGAIAAGMRALLGRGRARVRRRGRAGRHAPADAAGDGGETHRTVRIPARGRALMRRQRPRAALRYTPPTCAAPSCPSPSFP